MNARSFPMPTLACFFNNNPKGLVDFKRIENCEWEISLLGDWTGKRKYLIYTNINYDRPMFEEFKFIIGNKKRSFSIAQSLSENIL